MWAFAEGRVLHPRAGGPRPPASLRSRAPPSTSEGAYGCEPFPSVSGRTSDTLPSLSVSVTVIICRFCHAVDSFRVSFCCFFLFLTRCPLSPCQLWKFPPMSATLRLSSVSVPAIPAHFCHKKAWFCGNSLRFLPFLTRFCMFSCLFVGLRGGEGSPPSVRWPSPSHFAPLAGPSLYKRGCLRFRTLPSVSGRTSDTLPSLSVSVTVIFGRFCHAVDSFRVSLCCFRPF